MGKIKKMDEQRTSLTDSELSEIQSLMRQSAEVKLKVAEYAMAQKHSLDVLMSIETRISETQDTLAKKYGERPIDLKTGELK